MTDQVDRQMRALMARLDDMTPLPPAFEEFAMTAARSGAPDRDRNRPRVGWAVAGGSAVLASVGILVATRPDQSDPIIIDTAQPGSVASTTTGVVVTPDDIVGLWVFATRAVPVDENRVGTGWPLPSPLPAYRYEVDGTVRGFDGCNRNVATWRPVDGRVQAAAAPDSTGGGTAVLCTDSAGVEPVTVPPVPHTLSTLGGALTLLHTNDDGGVAQGIRVDDLPVPDTLAATTWILAVDGDDLVVSFHDDGTADLTDDSGPCVHGRYTYSDGQLELDLPAPQSACGDRQLGVLTSGPSLAATYSDGYASDTLLLASEHGAVRLFPYGSATEAASD